MTDDKVKEAAERVRIGLAHHASLSDGFHLAAIPGATVGDIRTALSEYDIAQAERDKLSAEVERAQELTLAAQDIAFKAQERTASAQQHAIDIAAQRDAAEAKLTALVERLRKLRREWEAIACAYKVHPQFEKGLRHCMIEVAALAHHSAPVGEAGE